MRTNLTVSAVKIINGVSRDTLLVSPSIKNDLGIDYLFVLVFIVFAPYIGFKF